MGAEVARLAAEGMRGASLACGIDAFSKEESIGSAPCYRTFDEACDVLADVVIDFSHHSVTEELLNFCVSKNLPVVVATTGHDEKELELIPFYERAKAVKELTDKYDVPLIINDRLSICIGLGADGAHIGQDDLDGEIARDII